MSLEAIFAIYAVGCVLCLLFLSAEDGANTKYFKTNPYATVLPFWPVYAVLAVLWFIGWLIAATIFELWNQFK